MNLLAFIGVAVCAGTYLGIAYAEKSQQIDNHIQRFFHGDNE